MAIKKYLDETGLTILWTKIKTADNNVASAANSALNTAISGVNTNVNTINTQLNSGTVNAANKDGSGNVITSTYIKNSQKGVANGVATLDSDGKVPESQLPAYVDDVVEYDALKTFPATGEAGKIYVDLSTNKTYRWSGSTYVNIAASIALGETSSTAYAGDKGKANATAIAALQTAVAEKAEKNGSASEAFNASVLRVGDTVKFTDTSSGAILVGDNHWIIDYYIEEGTYFVQYYGDEIQIGESTSVTDVKGTKFTFNDSNVLTEANIGAIDTATIEALS